MDLDVLEVHARAECQLAEAHVSQHLSFGQPVVIEDIVGGIEEVVGPKEQALGAVPVGGEGMGGQHLL